MNDERNDVVENISSEGIVNSILEPAAKKEIPLPDVYNIKTEEHLVEAIMVAIKQIENGESGTWEDLKSFMTNKHGIKW